MTKAQKKAVNAMDLKLTRQAIGLAEVNLKAVKPEYRHEIQAWLDYLRTHELYLKLTKD